MDTSNRSINCDAIFLTERSRLVRLCTLLTGNPGAAEDLAQETLLEAWRSAAARRDSQHHVQWLTGIARNVCRRWARNQGRRLPLVALQAESDAEAWHAPEERLAADFDLELELERDELAQLLDRAMALLPPSTRVALVQRYIQESPHAEIAARLGLSEGAVKMKLERGRLALRRLLCTELREEAAAYGLTPLSGDAWQETAIWCPTCGRRRLAGYFSRDERDGAFILRCPHCCHGDDGTGICFVRSVYSAFPHTVPLLAGVSTFKPALSRVMEHTYSYYREALAEGRAPCMTCGRMTRLYRQMPPESWQRAVRGVHLRCDACGTSPDETLHSLLLSLPEAREFWRRHPRIHALPEREIEVGGADALLVTFESLRDAAKLDIAVARESYRVISVNGMPAGD